MDSQPSSAQRRTLRVLVLLVIISWIVALFALPVAPARIVTHWGLNGEPNGYMNRVPGLLFMPALLTGLLLLFQVLPYIDPARHNYAAFAKTYRYIQLMLAIFLLAIQLLTLAAALGYFQNVSFWISLLIALLLIGLGNILGKLRPNWFAGIRTPWTLSSPEVWTKTHRLGGRLLVLVGLLMLVANLALPPQVRVMTMLVGLMMWVAVTVVYSYWVWHQITPNQDYNNTTSKLRAPIDNISRSDDADQDH